MAERNFAGGNPDTLDKTQRNMKGYRAASNIIHRAMMNHHLAADTLQRFKDYVKSMALKEVPGSEAGVDDGIRAALESRGVIDANGKFVEKYWEKNR